MLIRGELQQMADAEISGMLDAERVAAIRATDAHPLIKVFAVGHEGEADGRQVAEGGPVRQAFRYFRDTVQSLYDRLSVGTPIFPDAHGATNATDGRTKIGEVVGRSIRDIGGKLHALAAIYVYPQYKDRQDDVASIEAEFEGERADDRSIVVRGIKRVTGIIVGKSDQVRPAFAGATLRGAMQMFALSEGVLMKIKLANGTEVEVGLDTLRAALRDEKIRPSSLYGDDDLKADERVKDIVDLTGRSAAARVKDDLTREWGTKETDYKNQITNLTTELGTARKEGGRARTERVFRDLAKERGLKEQQVKFVERALGTFEPKETDEAKAKTELTTFVDAQLNEYRKVGSEIFGLKFEDEPGNPPGPPKVTPPSKDAPSNPVINPDYVAASPPR